MEGLNCFCHMRGEHLAVAIFIPEVADDGIRLQHLLACVGVHHERELALPAHGLCLHTRYLACQARSAAPPEDPVPKSSTNDDQAPSAARSRESCM